MPPKSSRPLLPTPPILKPNQKSLSKSKNFENKRLSAERSMKGASQPGTSKPGTNHSSPTRSRTSSLTSNSSFNSLKTQTTSNPNRKRNGAVVVNPAKMVTHLLNIIFVTMKIAISALPKAELIKFGKALTAPFNSMMTSANKRLPAPRKNSRKNPLFPLFLIFFFFTLTLALNQIQTCTEIQDWQVHALGTETQVAMAVKTNSCLKVEMAERPTISLTLGSLNLSPALRPHKQFMAKVGDFSVENYFGCKGGWTFDCQDQKGSLDIYSSQNLLPHQRFVNRLDCHADVGWGEGCFIFGAGHLCSVFNFGNPAVVVHCADILVDDIEAPLYLRKSNKEEIIAKFSEWSKEALFNLGGEDELKATCMINNKFWLNSNYVCFIPRKNENEAYLVPKTVVDAMEVPWRVPNGSWHITDPLVTTSRCEGDNLQYDMNGDFLGVIVPTFRKYPKVVVKSVNSTGVADEKFHVVGPIHTIGSIDCRFDFKGIRPVIKVYEACVPASPPTLQTFTIKDNEVNFMFSLSELTPNPCTYRFDLPGCTFNSPQYVLRQPSPLFKVQARCSKGSYTLNFLGLKKDFEIQTYGAYAFVASLKNSVTAEVSLAFANKWDFKGFAMAVWGSLRSIGSLTTGFLSSVFGASSLILQLVLAAGLFVFSMTLKRGNTKLVLTWLAVLFAALAFMGTLGVEAASPFTGTTFQESSLGCFDSKSFRTYTNYSKHFVTAVDACPKACLSEGRHFFSFVMRNPIKAVDTNSPTYKYAGQACFCFDSVPFPLTTFTDQASCLASCPTPRKDTPSLGVGCGVFDGSFPDDFPHSVFLFHVTRVYTKPLRAPVLVLLPLHNFGYNATTSTVRCVNKPCSSHPSAFFIIPYGPGKEDHLMVFIKEMTPGDESMKPRLLEVSPDKLRASGPYVLEHPPFYSDYQKNVNELIAAGDKLQFGPVEFVGDWEDLSVTPTLHTDYDVYIGTSSEDPSSTLVIHYPTSRYLTYLYTLGEQGLEEFKLLYSNLHLDFILKLGIALFFGYFAGSMKLGLAIFMLTWLIPTTQATQVGCVFDLNSYELTCGIARSVDWEPTQALTFRPIKYLPFGPEISIKGLDLDYGITVIRTQNQALHRQATTGSASWNWFSTLKTMLTDVVTIPDPDGVFELGDQEEMEYDWTSTHEDLVASKKKLLVIGDCRTNVGNVTYVDAEAELHSQASRLDWTLTRNKGLCNKTECPVSKAICHEAHGYCAVRSNFWELKTAYGFSYTSYFRGDGANPCHHRRKEWTSMSGWLCSLKTRDLPLTRAHILPHTTGGQEKGYNCWLQTAEVNENATTLENKITSDTYIERSMASRFPSLVKKIFVLFSQDFSLTWKAGCFCGWNGVDKPPSCDKFDPNFPSNADLVVVSPSNIATAVKSQPFRSIIQFNSGCLAFREELVVKYRDTDTIKEKITSGLSNTWVKMTSVMAATSLAYFNPLFAALGVGVLVATPAEAADFEIPFSSETFSFPSFQDQMPTLWDMTLDEALWNAHLRWLAILLLVSGELTTQFYGHDSKGVVKGLRLTRAPVLLNFLSQAGPWNVATYLLPFPVLLLCFLFLDLFTTLKISLLLFSAALLQGFCKRWLSVNRGSSTQHQGSLAFHVLAMCLAIFKPLSLITPLVLGFVGYPLLLASTLLIVGSVFYSEVALWFCTWLYSIFLLLNEARCGTVTNTTLITALSPPSRHFVTLYLYLFRLAIPRWISNDWLIVKTCQYMERISDFFLAIPSFFEHQAWLLWVSLNRNSGVLAFCSVDFSWLSLLGCLFLSQLWSAPFGPFFVCALILLGLLSNLRKTYYFITPVQDDACRSYTRVKVQAESDLFFNEEGELEVPRLWYDYKLAILFLVGALVMAFLQLHIEAGVALGASLFFFVLPRGVVDKNKSTWDCDFIEDVVTEEETVEAQVPDGVYQVYSYFLLFPQAIGHIVFRKHVGHTSYHVTGGNPIHWNGKRVTAYYMSKTEDIATYGGYWSLDAVDETAPLYLSHPYSKSLVESRVKSSVAKADGVKTFITTTIMTQKGESGAPIYQKINGVFTPVAMNGLNYASNPTKNVDHAIFTTLPSDSIYDATYTDAVKQPGFVKMAALKPGSGKTRVIIPKLAADAQKYQRKMVILGPTRVVTREIHEALLANSIDFFSSIGNTKKRPTTQAGKFVQVMCHATYHDRLLNGTSQVSSCDVLVLDEAGFALPNTIHLNMIFRKRVTDGLASLIELSATGEEIVEGSRFDVTDTTALDLDKAFAKIDDLFHKKVILFAPSATALYHSCKGRYNSHKEWPVLRIDRSTFDENIEKASELKAGLLVCTRIAEAGFNPDADVVIDLQMDVMPQNRGESVELITTPITHRQSIQRRGRVGRRKPGLYITVGTQSLNGDRWNRNDAMWDDVAIFNVHPVFGNQPYLPGMPELPPVSPHVEYGTLNKARATVGASAAIALANCSGSASKHLVLLTDPSFARTDPPCPNCPLGKLVFSDARWHKPENCPRSLYKLKMPSPLRYNSTGTYTMEQKLQFFCSRSFITKIFCIASDSYPAMYIDWFEHKCLTVKNFCTLLTPERLVSIIFGILAFFLLIFLLILLKKTFKWLFSGSNSHNSYLHEHHKCGGKDPADFPFILEVTYPLTAWYLADSSATLLGLPIWLAILLCLFCRRVYTSLYAASLRSNSGTYSFLLFLFSLIGPQSMASWVEPAESVVKTFQNLQHTAPSEIKLQFAASFFQTESLLDPACISFWWLMITTPLLFSLSKCSAVTNLFTTTKNDKDVSKDLHSLFTLDWIFSGGALVSSMARHWSVVSFPQFVTALVCFAVFSFISLLFQVSFAAKWAMTEHLARSNSQCQTGEAVSNFQLPTMLTAESFVKAVTFFVPLLFSYFYRQIQPEVATGALIFFRNFFPDALSQHMNTSAALMLGAVIRGDYGVVLFFLVKLVAVKTSVLKQHSALQSGHVDDLLTLQQGWFNRIGRMRDDTRAKYFQNGVTDFEITNQKDRSYFIMRWLTTTLRLPIRGEVVCHSGGRDGFVQHVVQQQYVTDVHYNGKNKTFSFSTLGYNKLRSGIPASKVSWVVDFNNHGNSQTTKQLDINRLNWAHNNSIEGFMVELTSGYSDEIAQWLAGHRDVGLHYCPHTLNAYPTLYAIRGRPNNWRVEFRTMLLTLLRRARLVYPRGKSHEKSIPEGPLEPLEFPLIDTRITTDKPKIISLDALLENPPSYTYQTWINMGSKLRSKRGTTSNLTNHTFDFFTRGIRNVVVGFSSWVLSSTTAAAFHETFMRKYDRRSCQTNEGFLVFRDIMKWMSKKYMIKARRLSNEEIYSACESGSSVGHELFGDFSECKDLKEAMALPAFWEEVDREEQRLLSGQSKYGVFNTSPKREKISVEHTELIKNKRMIAYFPGVLRALEYRWLGYLNADHLCARENLPCGVGGMPLYEVPNLTAKLLGFDWASEAITKHFMCRDVSGWDTRMTAADLRLECESILGGVSDPLQSAMVRKLYGLYTHPVIAIPRPYSTQKDVVDFLQGYGQRMSGSIITYAMNTWTNAATLIMQKWETVDYKKGWLDEGAHDWLSQQLVAGDDSVIIDTPDNLEKLTLANESLVSIGKPRKGIDDDIPGGRPLIPTPKGTTLKEFNFCSHNISVVRVNSGGVFRGKVLLMNRSLGEILGKMRLARDNFVDSEAELAFCAGIANQLLVLYPHRRDCRLIAQVLKTVVPPNLIPMGYQSRAFHGEQPWLTGGDLIKMFNNMYQFFDATKQTLVPCYIESFSDICYSSFKEDQDFGSPIGDEARSKWKKALPALIRSFITTGNLTLQSEWLPPSLVTRKTRNTNVWEI